MGLALGVLGSRLGRRCRPRRERPDGASSSVLPRGSDDFASEAGSALEADFSFVGVSDADGVSALASIAADGACSDCSSEALSFSVRPLLLVDSALSTSPERAVGSLVGVADSSALALFCSSTNHFRVTVKKEKKWDRRFAMRFVLTRIGLGVVPSQSRYTDVATDYLSTLWESL